MIKSRCKGVKDVNKEVNEICKKYVRNTQENGKMILTTWHKLQATNLRSKIECIYYTNSKLIEYLYNLTCGHDPKDYK